jgi:FtsH-binding integral membrane protein
MNFANATVIDTDNSGVRNFFRDVFMRMTAALTISAVTAGLASMMPFLYTGGILTWLIILSPLAFILAMSFGSERFSTNTLILLFLGFAVAQGLSMGSIFLVYTGASIITAFLVAAGVFATFAVIGYTTRRDLTSMGTFLFVGLIGIVIASVVNIWLALPVLAQVINVLAVIIFTGLTAYDVQKLKEIYYSGSDDGKVRTLGALTLYLDFINIFLALLQLFGGKRE